MFEKFRELLGREKAVESSKNTTGSEDELFTLIQKREKLMSSRDKSSKEAKFEVLFDLTKRIERLSEKRQSEKTGHPSGSAP